MKPGLWSALASVLALGGCAYATPYAMNFRQPTGTDRSSATVCHQAFNAPGRSDLVIACLEARGWDWEIRGYRIRQQAGYVGHLAIPATVLGLGLTAAGDRSDAAPLIGYGSATAFAHTSAYARPDQAEVYELATSTYGCLVATASEWRGKGKDLVDEAFADFKRSYDAADTFLRADGESANSPPRLALERQFVTAELAVRTLDSEIGLMLLRRSNEVESDARKAVGVRLPEPQLVAASIARSSEGAPVVPLIGENQASFQMADALKSRLAEVDRAAARLNAAVEAYSAQGRSVSVTCAFNPAAVPPLSAPATFTLTGNSGGFVVRGGIPPYGFDPLPTGVSATVTPIGSQAQHIQITVSDAAGAGPWALRFYDGTGVASTTVTVSKPAAVQGGR